MEDKTRGLDDLEVLKIFVL